MLSRILLNREVRTPRRGSGSMIFFLAAATSLAAFFGATDCYGADCLQDEKGAFKCSTPGRTYVWQRPPNVRWIYVQGVGGGGGGASGAASPCSLGGGGGAGAAVSTVLLGPLDQDRYEVYVGKGGDGGPKSDSAHPPIQGPGGRGQDTSFGQLQVFRGAEGGSLNRGGPYSGGTSGGDGGEWKKRGKPGGDSGFSTGGLSGEANRHKDKNTWFDPGGSGGGGGASLGAGGNGGMSQGFKYDGGTGTAGGIGAGGGGGGTTCWHDEGNRSGGGGSGGGGSIVIVPTIQP
jgi:hypothetical protein